MDLVNTTPFAANFFNTIVGQDRMLGAVVVRTIHRIEEGRLVPDPAREWPVTGSPYKTEFGEFDGESPFVREGCDLFVLGYAYPGGEQGKTRVEISVGSEFRLAIQVFGDRAWELRGQQLIPTAPKPFQRIPLVWERAFGGTCEVEGLDLPWSANPKGCGFYWEEWQATDQPLPNLEDPNDPIRVWSDRPEPVGTAPYPRDGALRVMNGIEMDSASREIRRIKPCINNNAPPRLILPQGPRAGDMVRVAGVRPDGRVLEFRMPDEAYHVYVQLKDRAYVFPAQLEAMAVLAEEERVMLGYRCCFRYRLVPLERRAAVLYAGTAPSRAPAEYRIDWAAFDARDALRV
jgi:hypothetical protein